MRLHDGLTITSSTSKVPLCPKSATSGDSTDFIGAITAKQTRTSRAGLILTMTATKAAREFRRIAEISKTDCAERRHLKESNGTLGVN